MEKNHRIDNNKNISDVALRLKCVRLALRSIHTAHTMELAEKIYQFVTKTDDSKKNS